MQTRPSAACPTTLGPAKGRGEPQAQPPPSSVTPTIQLQGNKAPDAFQAPEVCVGALAPSVPRGVTGHSGPAQCQQQ